MRGLPWSIAEKRVPWTLWAYVGTTGINLIILLTRVSHVVPGIFAVVLLAAWDYFLLRAIRWVWIATLVLFAFSIVISVAIGTGTWWGVAIGLLQLCLLLLPPTRRFFASGVQNS